MREKIKTIASEIFKEIVEIRRHIHANPELSKKEFETAKFIANQLRDWGIECQEGIGGNGVVGMIRGKNPDKKCIALRADIDALPILEKNDIPYKSLKEGVAGCKIMLSVISTASDDRKWFEKEFNESYDYPVVLNRDNGQNTVILNRQDLNEFGSVEDLILRMETIVKSLS
jgi:PHD/YefM family antitoxin component YafN of YafNO toxin-antitoxin module